eukprot:snap_masked-scaffold_19-processed-gene-3.24-mRNA-1 protein AED:1.00 eAED:1.00 QI:0/-1/0/0/-1/1/1/0/550
MSEDSEEVVKTALYTQPVLPVEDKRKRFELSLRDVPKKIGCFVCCLFPCIAVSISAVFSIPLVMFAGWSSQESFFTVLLEISNANGHVLHSNQAIDEEIIPDVFLAKLIIIIAGFISLSVFGCFMGCFSAGPMDRPLTTELIDRTSGQVLMKRKLSEVIADNRHREEFDEEMQDDFYYFTHIFKEGSGDLHQYYGVGGCLFVFVVLPLFVALVSMVFGGILAIFEPNWTFNDGYWVVFGELLDMQLDLVEPEPIKSTGGKFFFCLMSMWSLGFFALILAFLSGPVIVPLFSEFEREVLEIREDIKSRTFSWQNYFEKLGTFVLIYLPLITGGLAIFLGLLLAMFGRFHAGAAISEVLAELMNMQTTLGDIEARKGFNRAFMAIIGLIGLVFFAVIFGSMSLLFVPAIVAKFNMMPDYTKAHVVRHSFFKLSLFVAFVVPVVAVLLSIVFGGILFALERAVSDDDIWTFELGFFVIFSEILDIQLEFYNIPEIDHGFAKLIMALIGCYSFAFFALITAVIGGPIILPIVHYYTNTTPFVSKSAHVKTENEV